MGREKEREKRDRKVANQREGERMKENRDRKQRHIWL